MSLSTSGTALGTVLAVIAAVAWAAQYLFVRIGTERGSVSDAMLVALACNVALVVSITGLTYYPEYGLSAASLLYFGGAGVAGSFLSRILQFESTRSVGASRTAPVVSTSSLASALLAVLFLDERLTSTHLIGIVLIVGAVGVLSWETAGGGESAPSLREGRKHDGVTRDGRPRARRRTNTAQIRAGRRDAPAHRASDGISSEATRSAMGANASLPSPPARYRRRARPVHWLEVREDN